jgi:hypothetical protein
VVDLPPGIWLLCRAGDVIAQPVTARMNFRFMIADAAVVRGDVLDADAADRVASRGMPQGGRHV